MSKPTSDPRSSALPRPLSGEVWQAPIVGRNLNTERLDEELHRGTNLVVFLRHYG